MYIVKCLRRNSSSKKKLYERKFETLSQVANFLEQKNSPALYVPSLTRKEFNLLFKKCVAIEAKQLKDDKVFYPYRIHHTLKRTIACNSIR